MPISDRSDPQHVVVLQRHIAPSELYEFIELPFEVPPATDMIHVACAVEGYAFAGKVVDLGVRDPLRVRGWSGGARDEFTLQRAHATPGYLAGELMPGTWAVLLASNRLPDAGCTATLTITYTPAHARWFKGDLHTHTVHSDGSYTMREALAIAEAAGLDFVALTDHNTSSQNHAYPRDTPLCCIPGMELTSFHGHSNLLGVVDPLPDFRVSTTDQVRARWQQARAAGAKIVLNHPFDPGCGWHYDWNVPFDWFEVWNGPWRASNQQALDWWHAQLVAGRRLVAVCGSDVHRPDPYVKHGWPTALVRSPSCTVHDLL